MINYWTKKELNKEKAREHIVDMHRRFQDEIEYSIQNSVVYTEENCMELLKDNLERDNSGAFKCKIIKSGIVEAVTNSKSKKNKICVLNFASYKNPGGMFIKGSSAQEECICHSSTLYPILEAFDDTFYHYNRENKNKALYKHRMIYTPDVIFIGEKGSIFKADVITIAAPNRGAALRNNVSEEEIESTMRERIQILMQCAYSHLVDILYLGAYGCGVFKNNPNVVAQMFYEEMGKYPMTYIYPIPDNENCSVFSNIMFDKMYRDMDLDSIGSIL